MGRKRSPEHDYICIRCGCPCDAAGAKHVGGGQNLRACRRKPTPRLRHEWDAEVAATVAGARSWLRRQTPSR